MVSDDPAKAALIDEVNEEFGELRQSADRLDEAVSAQFGLNRTDLRCLGIIYRRGRVTAGELAEESGLTPGAITTVLDRMERGGYANRVADPGDRRRVLVVSTAATREVGARVYGEVEIAGSAELEGHGVGRTRASSATTCVASARCTRTRRLTSPRRPAAVHQARRPRRRRSTSRRSGPLWGR